jgi:hypothetical protein
MRFNYIYKAFPSIYITLSLLFLFKLNIKGKKVKVKSLKGFYKVNNKE